MSPNQHAKNKVPMNMYVDRRLKERLRALAKRRGYPSLTALLVDVLEQGVDAHELFNGVSQIEKENGYEGK